MKRANIGSLLKGYRINELSKNRPHKRQKKKKYLQLFDVILY